ncbi:MAG TPA: PIN domain-containing protein [Candidatus Nanoarchaeia archaeon]|nr:PIN domain-containing protein [Candidatus Nanoarchaeia archaeon]
MGELKTFFFDTYAFFEIIKANQNYKNYVYPVAIITTRLNLMELHYGLLRMWGREKADRYYDRLLIYCIEISDEDIKKANEFRAKYKERGLSYIDCVGYTIAKSHGVKFLTGDRQFQDLDNVEFVK